MDGRPDACALCGVPLLAPGRFCSNCGAPVAPVTLQPTTPASPAPGGQPPLEADPYESLYAAPAPAAAPPPVVEPEPTPTAVSQPPPAPPAEALPPEPIPTRGPGPGLWIGAAALLVGVLVLGSYLLLHGAGGSGTAASSTPLVPKPHPTSKAASKAPSSAAPSSAKPSARPSGATEVAGLARASAPRHAAAAVDFAGRPVTYVAPNMVDGRADTCWRVAGNASGIVLTFTLAQPTTLTRVGLINGYAKIAFSHGHPVDWYTGNRRVLSVDWVFDDGTTDSQRLAFSRTMQRMAIDPVKTRTVKLRITSVSPPGRGRAARDDTAVSEVSLRGTTG